MNRLKELRTASGRTQAAVAAELGTNQQTYARWENGKSEPSHAILVRMSLLFGVTIDHILGRNFPTVVQRHRSPAKKEAASYWGDLGLRPRGASRTLGFPVTDEQAARIRDRMESGERLPDWITVETLSNSILAFQPKQMRRIWLVDEADEFPEEFHSRSPIYDEPGMPVAVYGAMVDWCDHAEGGEDLFSNHPKTLQKMTLAFIERTGFIDNPNSLGQLLRSTVVHHLDGETEAFEVDHDDLSMALFYLENSKNVDVIELSARDRNFERYHVLDEVALIEFPASELEAIWAKERGDHDE